MTTKNVLMKKSQNAYLASIIFFACVICFTIGLKFYNNYLEGSVEKTTAEIQNIETKIINVNANKKVKIYALVKQNEKSLAELANRSQITKYINHLDTLSKNYSFKYDGFALANGVVTSQYTSVSDEAGIAYQKATKFISEYRANEEALFDLKFVNLIAGSSDNVKFSLNLPIK